MASTEEKSVRRRTGEWLPLLGGPLLWLTQLNVAYWLVPAACDAGQTLPITLANLLFLVLLAATGLLAWRNWRQVGREWPSSAGEDILGERARFMAVIGLMATGLFGLFMLADLLPALIIHPCLE